LSVTSAGDRSGHLDDSISAFPRPTLIGWQGAQVIYALYEWKPVSGVRATSNIETG
jgi:hypothetical protein